MERFEAYEDLEEPCYLSLQSDHILVSYQMKSILTTHAWSSIKHLKIIRPRCDPATKPKVVKVPKIDLKHNIVKIRCVDGHVQLYRFHSNVLLHAFIAAALQGGFIHKITSGGFLRPSRVKWIPATKDQEAMNGHGERAPVSEDTDRT